MTTPFSCPHCDDLIFRAVGTDKLKARTSIVVIHKSEDSEPAVEINCPGCRKGVLLPLVLGPTWELKKAISQRLTIASDKRHALHRG